MTMNNSIDNKPLPLLPRGWLGRSLSLPAVELPADLRERCETVAVEAADEAHVLALLRRQARGMKLLNFPDLNEFVDGLAESAQAPRVPLQRWLSAHGLADLTRMAAAQAEGLVALARAIEVTWEFIRLASARTFVKARGVDLSAAFLPEPATRAPGRPADEWPAARLEQEFEQWKSSPSCPTALRGEVNRFFTALDSAWEKQSQHSL